MDTVRDYRQAMRAKVVCMLFMLFSPLTYSLERLCFRMFVLFYLIGEINEIIFEAMLMKKPGLNHFSKDGEFINGLQSHEALVQRHVPLSDAKVRIMVST